MVLNSLVVLAVARVSAEAWQWLSCIRDPFTGEELFDLLISFPFHQLGRLAICLCSFFCLPQPHDSYYSYLPSSDFDYVDDDDDEDSSITFDYDEFYYHSHSD
ncbi:hypothetical protein RIF29_42150 [Crotalaria pallida]|uniref:Uncharacterized protein n=1 Tax=Crotalaria pallida TaxID=3830 RepID=A0AAN9EBX7_CROPI